MVTKYFNWPQDPTNQHHLDVFSDMIVNLFQTLKLYKFDYASSLHEPIPNLWVVFDVSKRSAVDSMRDTFNYR